MAGVTPVYAPEDVGLGTAFERLAVYRRVRRWADGLNLRTALEGPVDGMAGMPGLNLLPLARTGTEVTVILPDAAAIDRVRTVYETGGLGHKLKTIVGDAPPAGTTYDLVLTYNALAIVDDWRAHLQRVLSWTHRWAIVSVSHPRSYGVYLSKGLKKLQGDDRPQLYEHEAAQEQHLEPELRRTMRVVDMAFVDCPWWPDLFVDAGGTLLQGVVSAVPVVGHALAAKLARGGDTGRAPGPFDYPPDGYPFSHEDEPAELARAMARHPFFDDRSPRVAGVFAHHRAYLLEK